jgi:hypothetical protein
MHVLVALASLASIAVILVDGFQAMVFPRRVNWRFRPTRLFFRTTWWAWGSLARLLRPGRRGAFLSVYGPLSMLALLITWVLGLVLAFTLLHWALDTTLHTPEGRQDFGTYLYMSGVIFFTLGFGDVTAAHPAGRMLTVVEAGMGFGFLAVVIGYLPVLYQAFSRREVTISMLDARAGSPPTAGQLILRLAQARHPDAVDPFLVEWERWSAELLESHISFPVLSYYRSQHDNQSWLAALTVILDTCALLLATVKGSAPYQAQLTFAMARHAAVDLALIFRTPPRTPEPDRLPPDRMRQLCEDLQAAGLVTRGGPAAGERLAELRAMYEPFVTTLGAYFLLTVPPVVPDKAVVDNWQTSAWTRRTAGIGSLRVADDHFD